MTDQTEHRLRLAHQARRAKEHQLDDVRRALCDIGFMDDDDPYSHADLADVIRQALRGESGYCPSCGRGDCAPTANEYEQRRQRADRAEATLREVLDDFEGYCRRAESSGYRDPIVQRFPAWRATLTPPAPASGATGPTVAECRDHDRRWALEREGE